MGDTGELERLETDLWRTETRFDRRWVNEAVAEDFVEIGRSGRVNSRAQVVDASSEPINAVIPLGNFKARLIAADVALVTYNSARTCGDEVQRGRRSSIWSRESGRWILRFHQGTPYTDDR
ncbi:MAG TPA: DUF4440 domain-containing protein [Opitutaceae bacterium]